jgi:hypothetical protein
MTRLNDRGANVDASIPRLAATTLEGFGHA